MSRHLVAILPLAFITFSFAYPVSTLTTGALSHNSWHAELVREVPRDLSHSSTVGDGLENEYDHSVLLYEKSRGSRSIEMPVVNEINMQKRDEVNVEDTLESEYEHAALVYEKPKGSRGVGAGALEKRMGPAERYRMEIEGLTSAEVFEREVNRRRLLV